MSRPVAVDGTNGVRGRDALALLFVALPNAIFLHGWIVAPLGSIAAVVLLGCVGWVLRSSTGSPAEPLGRSWLVVIAAAGAWCVLAGIGHLVYANSDWWVRDAVLLDLVREPWPVRYRVDGIDTLLRAPVGFYLPAAVVGKVFDVRVAELAMLAWTIGGIALVFVLMLRDRPTTKAACVRIGIFVIFSGMDILPIVARNYPHALGDMIEWWTDLFMYPSTTTQLFWAPNHALPGWIATAWLVGQDLRRVPIPLAILFVALTPIWSPLTALGLVPLVLVVIGHRAWTIGTRPVLRMLVDPAVLVCIAIGLALIDPFLLAGSGTIHAAFTANLEFVGDEIVPRYIEFVLVEFAGLAALLAFRTPRDPLLWMAIVVLCALPLFSFGPYNDLSMRTSIPALTLLAIRMGHWLSTPAPVAEASTARRLAVLLLLVGAVTPAMELVRPFLMARWPMDVQSKVTDVTRGTHYLTPDHAPWVERFLRPPSRP